MAAQPRAGQHTIQVPFCTNQSESQTNWKGHSEECRGILPLTVLLIHGDHLYPELCTLKADVTVD